MREHDERDANEQADGTDEATQALPIEEEPTQLIASPKPPRRMNVPPSADPPPRSRIDQDAIASGARTEVISMRTQRSTSAVLTAVVVAFAFAAGAFVGYTQRRPSESNVVARSLVGPQGGVLTFDDGGRLEVPSGALPALTAITIRKEKADRRVRIGSPDDPSSTIYEAGELSVYVFEPAHLGFQQLVTIELPRRGRGTSIFVDQEHHPRVIAGEVIGDRIRVRTTSFDFL
jgi:hypothetical protein